MDVICSFWRNDPKYVLVFLQLDGNDRVNFFEMKNTTEDVFLNKWEEGQRGCILR